VSRSYVRYVNTFIEVLYDSNVYLVPFAIQAALSSVCNVNNIQVI
jgi:hypothetical protein